MANRTNPIAGRMSRRAEELAYCIRAIEFLPGAMDGYSEVNLVDVLKSARRKLKPPAHLDEPERRVVAECVLRGIVTPVASSIDRNAMKHWLGTLAATDKAVN